VTLPRFVLVGVPRAGTTSLYHYLDQHPGVEVSERKEINFLAYPGQDVARRDYPWLRFDVRTLDDYEALFAASADRVTVDFSASCFRSPVAIERIQRYVPEARLFVLLRDPVARAWSAYLNRVRKGYESRSPDVALVAGQRAVDNGFYSARLEAFRDAFGPERVRVWLFDDLAARPEATVATIFDYLGVDPTVTVDVAAVYNRASVPGGGRLRRFVPDYGRLRRVADALPPPLRTAARQAWRRNQVPAPVLDPDLAGRLRKLYDDDIGRLEDLIGRDLGSWRSASRSTSPDA